MRALLLVCLFAATAQANTTVFLNRHGRGDIPRFGGGDRAWNKIVACVQKQYAPFAVDITDEKPRTDHYITAVVGGMASQRGLDDDIVNGVGPYTGELIADAVVNVFSQVGTGEKDIENLCAVTAHEVGHALGLDHEVLCGDIMSYYLDQCGARTFIDRAAPCGETRKRACGNDERTQNSYQRLAALVGLRDGEPPAPAETDPAETTQADEDADPAPVARQPRRVHHHHHRHHHRRRYVE